MNKKTDLKTDLMENFASKNFAVLNDAKLENLLRLIVDVIPVAYVFHLSSKCKNEQKLIIVLDRYLYQQTEETQNILAFAGMNNLNMQMIYYTYGTMNDMIKRGSLFFITHCIDKNCIYRKDEEDLLNHAAMVNADEVKLAAYNMLFRGTEKANDFFDGAISYFEQGKLNLAAFMLHQTCEQIFRTIIRVYRGKEYKSHQLILLRQAGGFYCPLLNNIFHPKESKELKWLELLQQSYIGARYYDDYFIGHKQLIFLKDKVAALCCNIRLLDFNTNP